MQLIINAWIFWILSSALVYAKTSVQFRVLVRMHPFLESSFRSAMIKPIYRYRSGRFAFRTYFDVNGTLKRFKKFSPQEILDAFCKDIFVENVNGILFINNPFVFGQKPAATKYLLQLTGHLGFPMITWDTDHAGAGQVSGV